MSETRMTTVEVVDAVTREYARLTNAVEALGDRASTVNVYEEEGWTAKDVLGQCIHWIAQPAFGMGGKLTPPSYVVGVAGPTLSGRDWNDRAVEYYAGWSVDEVRAELDGVVDALLEQARLRTDDEMNASDTLPYAGVRPLWNKIGTESFFLWPIHSDAIEKAAR